MSGGSWLRRIVAVLRWVHSMLRWERLRFIIGPTLPQDFVNCSVLLNIERVEIVPVPNDCTDGFGGAYWARPERYLEPGVQAGMSMLAALQPSVRAAGTVRLQDSLSSGEWDATYGHLRTTESTDLGYRLVIART
jgi:hypothetical protein